MNKETILTAKVLLLGADAVGKTTLLYSLKLNEIIKTIPTIGFNVEEIDFKDRKIIFFDLGGGEKIKYFWIHYMKGANCIIFMMDIGSKERLDYYEECFKVLLNQHKEHRNIKIIIFGNKFNDKIQFEPEELLKRVNFPPETALYILKGNVIKGEGLQELLDYIYNNSEFKEEVIEKKIEDKNDDETENKKVKVEEAKEECVKMFGLNDSGKTQILYLLKLGEEITTIPTIGFNCEDIREETWEKDIRIFDIGGIEKIRPLWTHYFLNMNGIIWVYDISNNETLEESQNELKKILDNPKVNENIPLLIYANKTDLNINGNKIYDFICGIKEHLNNRPYYIQECNKYDLESYKQGLNWLYNKL